MMGSRKILRRILPTTMVGDKIYGYWLFFKKHHRLPEKCPVRYSDHLFAIKTNGHTCNPFIQFLTDKEHVKFYVEAVLGKGYVAKTYDIIRNMDEFQQYQPYHFPCVLKPTHLQNRVIILQDDKQQLDLETIKDWFNSNFYRESREHNYRYLLPKVIVEEFISDDIKSVPKDYKFYCFYGEPQLILVDSNRFSNHTRNIYDTNWNKLPITLNKPHTENSDDRPDMLCEMLSSARKLASPFPFVRVDMYIGSTQLKVGEMTFVPNGSSAKVEPPEAQYILGSYFGKEIR